MKAALKQVVKVILVLFVLRPISSFGHTLPRKSDLKFYTVSLPIGYGALSAYNALPSALTHAPYAIRGLDRNFMSRQIGTFRTLDFEDDKEEISAPQSSYKLDRETFVKLFAHEFQDTKGNVN